MAPITINILTIFPKFFLTPLQQSIISKAQDKNLVKINIINIRDFAVDKHHTTDDKPYGGGPGMVMKINPIYEALKSLPYYKLPKNQQTNPSTQTILTSAKGKLFTQQLAHRYSNLKSLNIICGHYEGVDERVAENLADDEIRIGDYVMTGGEGAALVISDAVTRLIPKVLGNDESNKNESHSSPGFFSHPVYTRPENFNGWQVPETLLSGDHKKINNWKQSFQKDGKA